MIVTAQEAAREMLRRNRARGSLAEYALSIPIPGVPNAAFDDEEAPIILDTLGRPVGGGQLITRFAPDPIYTPVESRMALHHALMCNHIQACIEKPRGRSMLFAPPGSAKSTYGSVISTSWAMGRKKNQQLAITSYGSSIAAKQSRKVRTIVKSPAWSALWKEHPLLLDDQRAVDDWTLTNGSSLMSAGLLAGITGNRFDGVVIDDPVRNREEADSSTIQEKIYQEYVDTVLTRAKPAMWVLLIQTRWAENDLAGSILPEFYEGESGIIHCRDKQYWDVLCIPAKAERADDPLGRPIGGYLWPEWFPEEHWKAWENNPRAQRTWSALYQQRPAPLTGVHFSRDMFHFYEKSGRVL